MAIHLCPPASVTAGDTLAFRYAHPTYSASAGWALAYGVAGRATADVAGVPDGDGWTVTVPATWPAGCYRWALRVTRGGESYTVAAGLLTVQPDPLNAADGELESWEERTLAIVEAALAGTLTQAQSAWRIGDVQVSAMLPGDLLRLRTQLRQEIATQRRGGRRSLLTVGAYGRAPSDGVWGC